MGGTIASATNRYPDRLSYVLTRNLVSILENRRREFVSRLECQHARGAIDKLQRRVVKLAGAVSTQRQLRSVQQHYRDPPGDDEPGSNVFRYQAGRQSATPPAPTDSAIVEKVSERDALRDTEPIGEKAVMRISDILMDDGGDVDQQLSDATTGFIAWCQGGEPATKATASSIYQILTQSMDTLLGVRDGQEAERQGEFICFMNNAFCRVQFVCYTNAVRAGFGDSQAICGCCYVAEISVLDVADLESAQIDYLLSTSFNFSSDGNGEDSIKQIEIIMRLKLQLFESAAVSRLLRRDRVPIDELRELMMLMIETQRQSASLFRTLPRVASSRRSLNKKPYRSHVSAAAAALYGGVEAGEDGAQVDTAWNRRERAGITQRAASRALEMLDQLS